MSKANTVETKDTTEEQPTDKLELPKMPPLVLVLKGEVTANNIDDVKTKAIAVFESVNTDLQTDQDFKDAKDFVKWCKSIEDSLKEAKDKALKQTASIADMFEAIDEVLDSASTKRLQVNKIVTTREKTIKQEIVQAGIDKFNAYIADLNEQLGGKIKMPAIEHDFPGAIKRKSSYDSMRKSVTGEFHRAALVADAIHVKMTANLKALREITKGYEFLFHDAQELVLKENDFVLLTIESRINEHKHVEKENLKAEQERLQEEEQEKEPPNEQPETISESAPAPYSPSTNGVHSPNIASVPVAESEPQTVERPTDLDMVNILANHYNTPPYMVVQWLLDMNLASVMAEIK